MAGPINRHQQDFGNTNQPLPNGGQSVPGQDPFSINPWALDPGASLDIMGQEFGLEDPRAQGAFSFNQLYDHNSLTNPFYNRFANEIAPGMGQIYSMLHGGGENPAAGFGDYMTNYIQALGGQDWSQVFGRSDVSSLLRSLFSGGTSGGVSGDVAADIQGATDREIMSMFGDILSTAGFTGMTPAGKRGTQRAFQQLLENWRGASLAYPEEMSGNAFLNYVSGSGILDRLGL